DGRHVFRAGYRVVHERAGQELAAGVVDTVFAHRLAEPLRDAALDLAVHDHRIDHGADVVDAPIAEDLYFAGVAIDLDLAGVRAVAPGEVRRVVDRAVLQPELLGRIAGRVVGDAGDLAQRDAAVGAGNSEASLLEGDIAGRGFQQMCGNPLALLDHLHRSPI